MKNNHVYGRPASRVLWGKVIMAAARKIPTYFSHSYRLADRRLNEFFWDLFWGNGFSFTVDPQSGGISTLQLELMMRHSSCYVAVVTKRTEQPVYRCSPFILYEYGLAVQARKPRLVMVESGVPERFFPEQDARIVFDRRRLDEIDCNHPAIEGLAEKSRGYIGDGVWLMGRVGIILPQTDEYKAVRAEIGELLEGAGYDPVDEDLNFRNEFELALRLNKYDFIIVDVTSPDIPAWVYPLLHGQFVPTLKVIRLNGRAGSKDLPRLASSDVSASFPSKTLAIWWSDPQDLLAQLTEQLSKADQPRPQFSTHDEGVKYFRSLGRTRGPVFLSSAGTDNTLARSIGRALDLQNIELFHYQFNNTIELGTEWPGKLEEKVRSSKIFVPLLTSAYWRSEWCRREYDLALKLHNEGKITIIPYFLEESSQESIPIQGVGLHNMEPEAQVERVVNDLDARLSFLDGPRTTEVMSVSGRVVPGGSSVDVAILTILREEYEAIHRHLVNPQPVERVREFPNRYSWVAGEVPSDSGDRPYRVLLAIVGKGQEDALVGAHNTIDAFQPSGILLVGVAGGLKDGMKPGDVIVAERIYGYDYGRVAHGFQPRPDWNYPTDTGIVAYAKTVGANHPDWSDGLLMRAPNGANPPAVFIGPVASGNKVVDNLADPSFAPVLNAWPELCAVEMEGLGVVKAVESSWNRGRLTFFSMIRGISDMPRSMGDGAAHPAELMDGQRAERAEWKAYAAETAAVFALHVIRFGWPSPPRWP